jgi:hypothetical protein
MGVSIIGASASGASAILGAGEQVLAGSFGVFGKYSQTLPAGIYIASATAGSKGGSSVSVLLGTSNTSVSIASGASVIVGVPEDQSSLLFSSLPSLQEPLSTGYTLNAPDNTSSDYQWTSDPSKIMYLADNGAGTLVSALRLNAYDGSNYRSYWSLEAATNGSDFASTYSAQQSNSSSSWSTPIDWIFLNYSEDRFLTMRKAANSTVLPSYPNVLFSSLDGLTWDQVTLPAPFGSTTNQDFFPRYVYKRGDTYYLRPNSNSGDFLNNILYKTTDLTDATSYSDAETGTFSYLDEVMSGSPSSMDTDGAGTWVAVVTASGIPESPGAPNMMYSLDDGVTWSIGSLPAGVLGLSNAYYDSALSLWFMACYNNTQNRAELLSATSPNSTWNVHTLGGNANPGTYPRSLFKTGSGWQMIASNSIYTAWTTSSDPRSTSWSSSSSGTAYSYPHRHDTGTWFAMNGTSLAYSTTTNPTTSYSTTSWTNMSGQSFPGGGFAPDYKVTSNYVSSPGTQVNIVPYRAYDSSSYQNYYTRNTGTGTSGSWTRYFAPIGTGSSSVPIGYYNPNTSKFVLVNASTKEYATSTDGLTWSISAYQVPSVNFSYPPAGYRGYLYSNTTDDLALSDTSTSGVATVNFTNTDLFTLTKTGIIYSKPTVESGLSWSDGVNNYLTLCSNQGHILTTSDNLSWVENKLSTNAARKFVELDNKLFINYLDPSDGVYKWAFTTDGLSFTNILGLDGQNVREIAKVADQKYVGVENGHLQNLWVSTDLINWEKIIRDSSLGVYDVLSSTQPRTGIASDGSRAVVSIVDNSTEFGVLKYGYLDSNDQYGVVLFNSTFEEI